MELRQLNYFYLTTQLGSVTKAAEQLHIAQPTISIAIQKLEEEIGVQLFDRSQKHFSLTVEGRLFLQRIEDILSRLQNTVAEMNDCKTHRKGSIRIGIPPMLGAFLFPYIFKEFQQAYPSIELTIVEEGTLAIQAQLEHGELDIGVIMIAELLPCLAVAPITTGEICVCLPLSHPLRRFPRIPFPELRNEAFILLKEDTYARQLVLEECARHQFSPRIVFSSSQIETLLGLVEQGTGITFLLETILRKHSNVVSRPLANPLFIQAGLAWNKDRYISNAAHAFIDFIKEFPFAFKND